MPWAGDTTEEIEINQVKINERRKDQLKTTPIKVPNRPYSKAVTLDMIK